MKKYELIFYIFFISVITTAKSQTYLTKNASLDFSKNIDNHYFIENKGQWSSDVLYLTQMGGLNVWITKSGMQYEFYKNELNEDYSTNNLTYKKKKQVGHRIGYIHKGNNQTYHAEGKQKQTNYYNYLIGKNSSKHTTYVELYKEILIKEVYNGIDMRYYFDNGLLRYDYIVHPNADPNQISFSIDGSSKETYLNKNNELVFTTCFGEAKNSDLYCYQKNKKNKVEATFIKIKDNWKIKLENYNKNEVLIIDPLLYSTYIGGNQDDVGTSLTIDSSNNVYVTGWTSSINYDTTLGAFQTVKDGGNYDAFVSKLNSTGTSLIYSTYIGGNEDDVSNCIKVDELGNAYIIGNTSSFDFDITSNAFQTTKAGFFGIYDVFVCKLNSTGTSLLYSTYLGGTDWDFGNSIVIDSMHNAYITGLTNSTDFQTTSGVFQTVNAGGNGDVFVCKLNSTGTALIYSTFIGGLGSEGGTTIALDSSNNVYVTGSTDSIDFDITNGAYQTINSGGKDAFVCKLNTSGSNLIFSTLIGGLGNDIGSSIAIDSSKNAYITGTTNSIDYDVTSGAFQTANIGGKNDVFVTKINNIGTSLIYSTLIGGNNDDNGISIILDQMENAYITGVTNSNDFDVTPGAVQTTITGIKKEVFATKINNNGTSLLYSTYIGGNGDDGGNSIVIDSTNNAYITGYTASSNFDITAGVFQTTKFGSSTDAFVTKICMNEIPSIILTSNANTINQTLCVNSPIETITYSTTGATGADFSGLPSGVTGSWSANVITISGIPLAAALFNYTVSLTDGCSPITSNGILSVNPSITSNFAAIPDLCSGEIAPTLLNTSPNGVSGTWSPPIINNISSGSYVFTPSNSCDIGQTITVKVNPVEILTITNQVYPFSNEINDLEINVLPTGTYLYSLDNSNFQLENIFKNVQSCNHEIKVKSLDGCSVSDPINIFIYGYPKFFTPNNDTYNDYWNVFCSNQLDPMLVTIFDRYGKLIKQFNSNENGWDGKFDGHELPSDDYWFSIEYFENGISKLYKSHFTMKK